MYNFFVNDPDYLLKQKLIKLKLGQRFSTFNVFLSSFCYSFIVYSVAAIVAAL